MAKSLPLLATYRLQLHAGFALAAATRLVPYLARLGVSHVYASPLLQARRGSTHGYDVVDPMRLNPELGRERDLASFTDCLRRHGMGLVLDIVPNHMGTGSENPAWEDVLQHGLASPSARWFDIDWRERPGGRVRPLFLPVLGARLPQVLRRGEIEIVTSGHGFRVRYFDHTFPLEPRSAAVVLRRAAAVRGATKVTCELEHIAAELERLPGWTEEAVQRRDAAARCGDRLIKLRRRSAEARRRLDRAVSELSRDRRELKAILLRQPYRLAHWRRAARRLNYRRFFDINELIAVRQEDPAVFAATHERIREWIAAGRVDALRVDHIDGLRDPDGYLRSLQSLKAGPSRLPVYVEKILAAGEDLPAAWPVEGTTGYEFLNQLDALFVDPRGFPRIETWYRERVLRRRGDGGFEAVVRRNKRAMLEGRFRTDVSRLVRLLQQVVAAEKKRPIGSPELRLAIIETITCLGVYRTYVTRTQRRALAADRSYMAKALSAARRRAAPRALALLADVFERPAASAARLRFVERLQQTSGPAMAKGLEDTAHYVYVPLASRNEVGGAPGEPLEDAVRVFHGANAQRTRRWPRTMLATDTHDTKRSADVRARLNALSEIPDEWIARVERWRRMNAALRPRVGRRRFPDANTEYLLYQTLVGIWPAASTIAPEGLGERLREYMLKAAREAKVHTSWRDPDAAFEGALAELIDALLSEPQFVTELAGLVNRIGRAAMWTSLSRTLLHLTAPGVPDLYQGTDLWSLALVDPDNRRPVDYARRRALVGEVEAPRRATLERMMATVEDGRLKLCLTMAVLRQRRERCDLFLRGSYEPLVARGPAAAHVVAYVRRHGNEAAVIIAPRLVLSLTPACPRGAVWNGTSLSLPAGLVGTELRCALSGATYPIERGGKRPALALERALAMLPVALLTT